MTTGSGPGRKTLSRRIDIGGAGAGSIVMKKEYMVGGRDGDSTLYILEIEIQKVAIG